MHNHVMHAKDRMTFLQMETTLAVLGDDRRYHARFFLGQTTASRLSE